MRNKDDASYIIPAQSDQENHEFQDHDEIRLQRQRAIQRKKRQCGIQKQQVHAEYRRAEETDIIEDFG